MTRTKSVLLGVTATLAALLLSPVAAQFDRGGEVRFDEGDSALDIPFELNSDKIYLDVKINGQGPFALVLDTGAPGMMIDTKAAEKLGVKTGEAFGVGGAGENPFMLAPAEGRFDAVLPGVELLDQPAMVGPLDEIVGPFEGRVIYGTLGGYNIFATHVVEVDYMKQVISIYTRDGFEAPAGGTEVPIRMLGGHCVVSASARLPGGDTLNGEFMLDTGLRGTMVFNTPFVNEHDLLNRCGTVIYTTVGGGLGGQVKAHVGRIERLDFGGFPLDGICVSLSQLSRGALAAEDVAGIIGSAVLQRFRVVFDYAGERLILYPQEVDAERLDFDKSGTFLVSDLDDRSVYRVLDVIEESPADEAGLEIGDVVREIDGSPATEVSLEQARRLFRREAGTTYTIVYERGGRRHTTKLTLRRVI